MEGSHGAEDNDSPRLAKVVAQRQGAELDALIARAVQKQSDPSSNDGATQQGSAPESSKQHAEGRFCSSCGQEYVSGPQQRFCSFCGGENVALRSSPQSKLKDAVRMLTDMQSTLAHLMPKRIVLVRHGTSEGNADESLYRDIPDNLINLTTAPLPGTESDSAPFYGGCGVLQAEQAGKRFKQLVGNEPVFIFHSPFNRTVQTCLHMRKAFESQVVRCWPDPRLREQEFANLQSEEMKDFRTEQEKVGRFWYRFPTGESGADVFDRTKQWWESVKSAPFDRLTPELLPVWAESTLLVVTHGLTMRLVLMQLYDWSPNTFHTIWNARNCDFYVLDRDTSYHRLYRINSEQSAIMKSSIELTATMKDGRVMDFTNANGKALHGFLEIPQPRTHQLEYIKERLASSHGEEGGFTADDIELVVGFGHFQSFTPRSHLTYYTSDRGTHSCFATPRSQPRSTPRSQPRSGQGGLRMPNKRRETQSDDMAYAFNEELEGSDHDKLVMTSLMRAPSQLWE